MEKCLGISIGRVLITCRESNVSSEKTIKSCSGVYEDTRYCEKEKDNFKRYWINLKGENDVQQ